MDNNEVRPRGTCAFGQHEWAGTSLDARACICGELTVMRTTEHAKLIASRDTLKAAIEWQPIGTAPKDGRMVLLHPSRCWTEDVNCDAEVGYWDEDCGEWIAAGPVAEDYFGPTHWMPLPAPPAALAACVPPPPSESSK